MVVRTQHGDGLGPQPDRRSHQHKTRDDPPGRGPADGSAVAAVVRQLNDLLAPMVSQLEAPAPAR